MLYQAFLFIFLRRFAWKRREIIVRVEGRIYFEAIYLFGEIRTHNPETLMLTVAEEVVGYSKAG
jgi:hypothetical protein